ncbi:hypothetical protein K438DRAFT_1963396 [Mycena galopus ATCC 62051]|nr:hypothetical protein K438DRAFT_1963396 [Mycena galopus ATCC 62051]
MRVTRSNWGRPTFFTHPHHRETLEWVFNSTVPANPQVDIPLLLLAVLLKAAMKDLVWLQHKFPSLMALEFHAAPPDPTLLSDAAEYFPTGMKKTDTEKYQRRKEDPTDSYQPPGARVLAPTTFSCGQRSFAGHWYGELGTPAGYSVTVGQPLSQGSHGVVYAGQLWQAGISVSDVAIKVSDTVDPLLAEFARYQELEDTMRNHIPKCYGVFVATRTAFLVTELLEKRHTLQSKGDRAAIYETLAKLHHAGWIHNDVVDSRGRTYAI